MKETMLFFLMVAAFGIPLVTAMAIRGAMAERHSSPEAVTGDVTRAHWVSGITACVVGTPILLSLPTLLGLFIVLLIAGVVIGIILANNRHYRYLKQRQVDSDL